MGFGQSFAPSFPDLVVLNCTMKSETMTNRNARRTIVGREWNSGFVMTT